MWFEVPVVDHFRRELSDNGPARVVIALPFRGLVRCVIATHLSLQIDANRSFCYANCITNCTQTHSLVA